MFTPGGEICIICLSSFMTGWLGPDEDAEVLDRRGANTRLSLEANPPQS